MISNKNFIKMRKELGLTQNEMAKKIGISRRTIVRWEDIGVTQHKVSNDKLYNALGKTFPEFFKDYIEKSQRLNIIKTLIDIKITAVSAKYNIKEETLKEALSLFFNTLSLEGLDARDVEKVLKND